MVLTPGVKFLVIAIAFTVNLLLLIWTGIKLDVLALGLNDHIFNIGLTIFATLNVGSTGLLAYLGMKAPTIEPLPPIPPKP